MVAPEAHGREYHVRVAAFVLLACASGAMAHRATAACVPGAPIELISRNSSGEQANAPSLLPAASGDGCVVAFKSEASNLVSGTVNRQFNVFVQDRRDGSTTRVPPPPAAEPKDGSFGPAINACVAPLCAAANDGEIVAFGSLANNLVRPPADANQSPDMFVFDRSSGAIESLTFTEIDGDNALGGGGVPDEAPSLSADGTRVAFASMATNLVPYEGNGLYQVYVYDRTIETTTLASVATVGGPRGHAADGASGGAALSGNGCVVAFRSSATTLVANDTNEATDVFVRDLCANPPATERVSVSNTGGQANGASQATGAPSLSYDGRYVAFDSDASTLDAGDNNGRRDVFVRDRLQGVTFRVSMGPNGEAGNGDSAFASISADGHFVAFQSTASNLVPGDTNGRSDIFVVEITGDVARPPVRVSVSSTGAQGNGDSTAAQITADGLTVLFQSSADNLVPGDTNGDVDVFAVTNPLASLATPTPTATVSATPTITVSTTPTTTAQPTGTVTGGPTGSVTPTAPVTRTPGVDTTPTATTGASPKVTPSVTPTPTGNLPPGGTVTPTAQGGGGGSGDGGGGGGGCSCRIDGDEDAGSRVAALMALALPVVLAGLSRRSRRLGRRSLVTLPPGA